MPAGELREPIRRLFEKADKVCLVAQDHVRAVGRFLGMELRNAVVVQNPVNLPEAGRDAPVDRSLQIGDRGAAAVWDGEPQGGGCRTERSPSLQAEARMACVARFEVRDKGQDLLLEALGDPVWRERDFRLDFFGSGPDREILEDLISFYGLGDKVRIVGFESDIRKIWNEHQLLVLPSLSEGTPISLIEAQLCGRASLVTRVDGNPEWVEEGNTGFLAEAPTVHHLRLALERAWENRHRWAEMGEAARAACLAKRDPDPAGTLLRLLKAAAEA
jgi:glycosyltransferase involved in cell wall biosynthesis